MPDPNISGIEQSKQRSAMDPFLIGIIAIFCLGLLPLVATCVFDIRHAEQFYTDGAILMRQNNDFITPREGDGTLRLRKPPLTYWLIVASHKLLGVSFFSSRIPFLLLGGATIWVAYILALRVTNDINVARTTALMLLSQPLLLLLSVNAATDILLTFCMLVSALGFIRLICQNDIRSSSYWCAYGGAAMAVATKGLLPIVFLAYALIFAYFTSSSQQPFRRVLHFRIILVSILIACFGFALMFWKNGWLFLQSFWNDQAGTETQLEGGPFRVVVHFLLYVPLLLPWLLCLAFLFWTQKPEKPVTAVQRKTCVFILVWAALFPIIFGFGRFIEVRYLLPALTLLPVVMAIGLCRFPISSIAAVTNRLLNFVTIVFLAICILGWIFLWQTGFLAKHFAGVLVLCLAFAIVAVQFQRKRLSSPAVLSLSIFLFLPLAQVLASVFTLPDQTSQVADALQSLQMTNKPVYAIGRRRELASQLRIANGGKYVVYDATLADLVHEKNRPSSEQSLFVLSESEIQNLTTDSIQLREIASGFASVSVPKLFAATVMGRAKDYLESRRTHSYAVLPDSTPTSSH